MSCRESLRLLDAYADGELDVPGALEVEAHVHGCPSCKAALGRLNALRTALRGPMAPEAAPEALRLRLQARFAPRPSARPSWRWGLAAAAPGVVALALALWLVFSAPGGAPTPSNAGAVRVVYHISSTANARDALRNLANHLNASPDAKMVVVAHNEGVDFLLRGARDASGQPFEPDLGGFFARGVEFRVCYNTLERRHIPASEVIPGATLVPSGIAEIGRLQSKEGYAYMRL